MLHEVELKRALQAYMDGKEVKAILPWMRMRSG